MSPKRISRRRFLADMGAAGITTLAGCTAIGESPYSPGDKTDTEWPMPAYDRGYSGFNPEAAAPREGVTERWSTTVYMPSGRPIVAAKTVFVPTAGGLRALDIDTGKERWHVWPKHSWPHSPVVHDGTVYVTSPVQEPSIRAFDVRNGSERWRLSTRSGIRGSPTFSHKYDWLFVGDSTGRVYQVDPASGEVKQTVDVFGEVTALAYYPPSLFVGTYSGEMYELHPPDPQLQALWRRKLGGSILAVGVPDSWLCVTTFDGPLYRLSRGARTGSSRWKTDVSTHNLAATPYDIVGTNAATMRIFDARTGNQKWMLDNASQCSPAIAGDTLYVGTNDRIEAYALNGGTTIAGHGFGYGEKRWSFSTKSAPLEGIAVADGAVFAVTGANKDGASTVYALDSA
jgi:outer membrane protein assembly factor BamB